MHKTDKNTKNGLLRKTGTYFVEYLAVSSSIVSMSIAFHVNLTSFFNFSCHFNEKIGKILMVQFLCLYSAVAIC